MTSRPQQGQQASLDAAVRDGAWYSVMVGAGEQYLTPFGLYLQASTFQIGVLAALPPLIGAISQALGVSIAEQFSSRRRVIVVGAAVQALAWPLIALVPAALGAGSTTASMLIAMVVGYQVAGNLVGPAWNSLIGDLVPDRIRGRYFGYRNQVCGLATFLAMTAGGALLHLAQSLGHTLAGFLVLFTIACLARLRSALWLSRYDDPETSSGPTDRFSFAQFLSSSPHANFLRFVLFVALINFAVAFSGPYFTVYMLQDLGLSYLEYTTISAALTLTQFLTMRHWGRIADQFGNRSILSICGWGVVVCPLFWVFSGNSFYLLAVQVFSGFVWAGFNLATASFLFDAVPAPRRARCAAYQAMVTSLFTFTGSLAGGFAATHLPPVWTILAFTWRPASTILELFLISTLLRVLAVTLFLPLFREVRAVESIGAGELVFRIVRLRPATGASFGLFEEGRSRSREALDGSH